MADSPKKHLYALIDELERMVPEVTSQWIVLPTVARVLKERSIASGKFRDRYAIPIFEYFLSVVRGEKEAGNCPVMSQLVAFLLQKEITPKEVFEICRGLRRALIAALFRHDVISGNEEAVIEEVDELFDANLAGVLDVFGAYYREKQQHISLLEQHDRKLKQILKIINFIRTKIFIAQGNDIILGNKPFFHTFGLSDLHEFHERFEQNWSFMEDVDIEKELFEQDKEKWLHALFKSERHFKADIYHALARKALTYSGRVTVLPDTEPPQYLVTLTNIAPHIEDEAHLRDQLLHDPMTGFSNYAQFEHLLGEARESDRELALVIVDLQGLKHVNETKGRKAGDDMVMEAAQMITFHSDESMVLGRLEGNRFGILRYYATEQECYDWASTLYDTLCGGGEKVNAILTGFDPAESTNRLLLRAFDLVEIAGTSNENRVLTDFENVDIEPLPPQQPFIEKMEYLRNLETTFYYKEMPIISKNEVLQIDATGITLRLERKQIPLAAVHERIYFRIPQMGAVKARVERVDHRAHTVKVNQFRKDRHSPLERKKLRVRASEGVHCRLHHESRVIEGRVLDLNDSCLAMDLTRKKSIDTGSRVRMSLHLQTHDMDEAFEAEASVVRIEQTAKGYKVVLAFKLHGNDEAVYNQYIVQRQMELIQELRHAEY